MVPGPVLTGTRTWSVVLEGPASEVVLRGDEVQLCRLCGLHGDGGLGSCGRSQKGQVRGRSSTRLPAAAPEQQQDAAGAVRTDDQQVAEQARNRDT